MNEVETLQFIQDVHHAASYLKKWDKKTDLFHLHKQAQRELDVDFHDDLKHDYNNG